MEQAKNYPEAMIFDLDGTLFQTETVLIPAYLKVFDSLREKGLYVGATPDHSLILGSLGMLLADIWMRVMPHTSLEVHRRANVLLLDYQLAELNNGVGALYPNVESTLKVLKAAGVRLFVASNGLEAYVKDTITAMGLDGFFEAIYSAGEFATRSKVDLVRMLMEKYQITDAWMIGDRSSDIEAGKGNELYVVGCSYAEFGNPNELNGANVIIGDFRELLLLNELLFLPK